MLRFEISGLGQGSRMGYCGHAQSIYSIVWGRLVYRRKGDTVAGRGLDGDIPPLGLARSSGQARQHD